MGVTMLLLLLFPFALLIYQYVRYFGTDFVPTSISLADIKTEFANEWTEQSDDMVIRLIGVTRLWLLFASVILIWPFITALAERFHGTAYEARRFFSWSTYTPYFFSAMILVASFGLIGMRSQYDALRTTQDPTVFKVVGQSVKTPSYNFRILDYFVTDRYYYRSDPSKDETQEAYPTYGKFVVVTYSVTNTSPETVIPYLNAAVSTDTAAYRQSTNAYPRIVATQPVLTFLKLAPQQVGISQFIFDVPTDAEVEKLGVSVLDEEGHLIGGTRVVALTSVNHQGPRPEEIVALQFEYINMARWEQAYELHARESKDQFSLQQYTDYASRLQPVSYLSYSFSSVNVDGNHATIEGTSIVSDPRRVSKVRISGETTLEAEGWRIVASPEFIQLVRGEKQSSVDRENVP
jgi:hypothetical protein